MKTGAFLRRSAAAGLALAATIIIGGAAWAGTPSGDSGRMDAMGQTLVAPSADAQITRVQASGDVQRGAVTNLPLPRYVSLKGNEGNARRGPSLSHRIDWVFRHAGMPLRVVAEFGHWRRVEDKDGMGGWVHYALLSGVRTALVDAEMAELRSRPDPEADIVARAETGAILKLGECRPFWCRVSGAGLRGWVPKNSIWGVDPNEIRE